MVVNRPVVNNPKIFVFIRNRLLPSLHVNNAEPAHGQPDISLDEKPVIVRPAVHDLPVHPHQRVAVRCLPVVRIENSANSAHGLLSRNGPPLSDRKLLSDHSLRCRLRCSKLGDVSIGRDSSPSIGTRHRSPMDRASSVCSRRKKTSDLLRTCCSDNPLRIPAQMIAVSAREYLRLAWSP